MKQTKNMKQCLLSVILLLILTTWTHCITARAGIIEVKREERSLDVSNDSQISCPNVEVLRGRDG